MQQEYFEEKLTKYRNFEIWVQPINQQGYFKGLFKVVFHRFWNWSCFAAEVRGPYQWGVCLEKGKYLFK